MSSTRAAGGSPPPLHPSISPRQRGAAGSKGATGNDATNQRRDEGEGKNGTAAAAAAVAAASAAAGPPNVIVNDVNENGKIFCSILFCFQQFIIYDFYGRNYDVQINKS